VSYILRENFTPDENFLSMREKQRNMAIGHEPSYSQGEIHDFLQETHETLEQQHQKAERVAQLDEKAIQDIEEAMQDFEKERAIIQALADIPHDEFQEALQEGNQVAIQDMLDTAAKRAEIPNAFGDEQYIQNLHQDLQEMEDDIREAHNILQTADELMEDEVDHDLDLEQAMETFEASYIDQLEGALNILEQYLNG
jgi:sugar-specific transcriptional regulator TrmB